MITILICTKKLRGFLQIASKIKRFIKFKKKRLKKMKSFTLHIFLSSIESETRLYKEAAYTLKHGICSRVVVLGLWDKGLKKNETTFDDLEIIRIATLIRNLQKTSVFYRISFLKKLLAYSA